MSASRWRSRRGRRQWRRRDRWRDVICGDNVERHSRTEIGDAAQLPAAQDSIQQRSLPIPSHLKDRLEEGKKKLDEAREALRYLCEPVALPREVEQFLHYFCGDAATRTH